MSEPLEDEHLLNLPGGGVIAYADIGNRASTDVVIFFHGAFSVGIATRLAPIMAERDMHYIAPTLPGWGESSSCPANTPYHLYLYQFMTALITALHPNTDNLRLYVGGGSMGTVISQMLYGAPYDLFPLGRHIVGMLLGAPFSPPHVHRAYRQCLSFPNWLMVGPAGSFVPFKLIPHLGKLAMRGKMDTREHAEEFIRDFAFTRMSPEERTACEKWKATRGIKDGEEGHELAGGVYRSVRKTWDGFMAIPDIFQSGWGGYVPAELDEEHCKPVLIVVTDGDVETKRMGEWLGANMRNSRVRCEAGGHIGIMFVMDDIWEEFIKSIPVEPSK